MRSRYSAYVLDLLPYLLDTWAPETRPDQIDGNEPGLKWLGLQVKRHEQQGPQHATVHFVARYKIAGRAFRINENSMFERRAGRWLYVGAAQVQVL